MSRMSFPSTGIALPFKLRNKQPLIRYSMVSTVPERERYWGYRPVVPTHDWGERRPSSRWQLTHLRSLPT